MRGFSHRPEPKSMNRRVMWWLSHSPITTSCG